MLLVRIFPSLVPDALWAMNLFRRGLPETLVMLQAGVWDVDGTGMWAIDDPEVDLGIRKVGLPPFCFLRLL